MTGNGKDSSSSNGDSGANGMVLPALLIFPINVMGVPPVIIDLHGIFHETNQLLEIPHLLKLLTSYRLNQETPTEASPFRWPMRRAPKANGERSTGKSRC